MIPAADPGAGAAELHAELSAAFERVSISGRFLLGPEVTAFEREFRDYCGAGCCVTVGSGTDALSLLLRAHGVRPGDEVIVPAYTAAATWLAVSAIGATPVGADVDAETLNLDPAAARAAFTARTSAIVLVHLFGRVGDVEALGELAARRGVLLIEDAAHAHGARGSRRHAGALADGAAFSFYPTKNLGALGDGAVTTERPEVAERVRRLRSYGWSARDVVETKGVNSRLDELQAALLRIKLGRLDDWNRRRARIAERYRRELEGLDPLHLPPPAPGGAWHQFVVRCEARDELRSRLDAAGVGTLSHYHPLPHLTPAYRADGWAAGAFPVAERATARAVSLPLFPQLKDADADRVIGAVRAAIGPGWPRARTPAGPPPW